MTALIIAVAFVATVAMICLTIFKVAQIGATAKSELVEVVEKLMAYSDKVIVALQQAQTERAIEVSALSDKLGDLVGMVHWGQRAGQVVAKQNSAAMWGDDEEDLENANVDYDENLMPVQVGDEVDVLASQAMAEWEMAEANTAITAAMAGAAARVEGDE